MTVRDELREELACLAHSLWAGWMRYLFKKSGRNDDGTVTIPKWAVDRWQLQICTVYNDLSASEKESDRKEADRMLDIMERLNTVDEMLKDKVFTVCPEVGQMQ